MKSLTVKGDDRLYRQLDRYVRRKGYTKNGLIVSLLKSVLRPVRGLRGVPLYPDHPYWGIVGKGVDREGATDVSENRLLPL